MLKLFGSISFMFLLIFATLFSGCSGGGGGGTTLENPPFSRRTGSAAQSQDLAGALDNVDMPTNEEVMAILNSEDDPESFLGSIDLPTNIAYYYPLGPGLASSRLQTGGKSPMMARNELVIAALARALTREARSSERDTRTIDYTGDNGIHWLGTYTHTISGTSDVINLNVSGTRNALAITLRLDASSNLSLSANSSSSHSTFSYSFQADGNIGNDTIDLSSTGSGASNDMITFEPSVDTGNIYEECLYRIAIGDRVKYRSKTELDLEYVTPENGDSNFTLDYSADAWLFARDGYWVHAIAIVNSSAGDSTYTLDAIASDGYSLVFDGEIGYLFDDEDAILANLSFNREEELAIKVDFTAAMQAQGTPDYVFIYLYMLD